MNRIVIKKVLLGFLTLIIVAFAITYLTGYSLILALNKPAEKVFIECDKGILTPFKSYDFSEGDWEMLFVVSSSDMDELPENFKKRNCFKTNDLDLLRKIKNEWKFQCSNGKDLSTVESKLYLYKNKNLVFVSGIVLNSNREGLQSSEFGWIESSNRVLSKNLKEFQAVYFPIVLL